MGFDTQEEAWEGLSDEMTAERDSAWTRRPPPPGPAAGAGPVARCAALLNSTAHFVPSIDNIRCPSAKITQSKGTKCKY